MTVVVRIGPYTVGEIPAPLVYQFLDADGAAIDLTGYAARFAYAERWGIAVTANAVVTAAATGHVTYTWDGTEFLVPGQYTALFWVGNNTNRFASVRLEYDVQASVGAPPSI